MLIDRCFMDTRDIAVHKLRQLFNTLCRENPFSPGAIFSQADHCFRYVEMSSVLKATVENKTTSEVKRPTHMVTNFFYKNLYIFDEVKVYKNCCF